MDWRPMFRIAVPALLAMLVVACQSGLSGTEKGAVSHVVIGWLKQPGNQQARRDFLAATAGFSDLPGVVDHKAGLVLPSGRKVVDSSFDVAAVITFKDRESLQAYLNHPRHLEAVQKILKPLLKKLVVYDIQLQ